MTSELEGQLYESMFLVRAFEERVRELFAQGELAGTAHPCIGQEAVAAGVISALRPGDIVTSTHRSHGHFLAFTNDPDGLMAELMGRVTGVCAGRGGSQHLHTPNFYTNGITGGMAAVGTGMALAEKRKGSGAIVTSFIGDGSLAQGVLHEAMNMASLWRAPIVYVLENNLYAMSTHVSNALAGDTLGRARAVGIPSRSVNEPDVMAIRQAAIEACSVVREGPGPFFLEVKTYRFCGHSINDDCAYRPSEEEALWLERDPVARLGRQMDPASRTEIEERCRLRIDASVERARSASFQSPAETGTGLWQR